MLLPDLLETYRARLLDHQNVVRAEVTTAAPLAADRAKAIERSLAQATGRTVALTTRVAPEMIGGLVARVGSTVYDGSVTTQLEKMRQRLGARSGSSAIGIPRCAPSALCLDKDRTMDIKADEISKIIREQIGSYAVDVDVAEVGSIISIGDGIARVHGVENAMAGEMLEFPHGVMGIALNLEEESVGAVLLGEFREIKEGDLVKRTGRIISVPVGDEIAWPRGERTRPADRRQGSHRQQAVLADRAARAGRRRPAGREGAAADGPEGDRRDGADRPRPARADHRRPADRQDGRRHRRDSQSARDRRHLHLQRHRAEAVHDRAGGADARRSRRHALHDCRGRGRGRSGAASVHQSLFRLHDR